MRFVLERVTQPSVEPVTLAQAKTHLRQYSGVTDDDAQITDLIIGAREWAEDFTGRALVDQTWRLTIGANVGSVMASQGSVYIAASGFYTGNWTWVRVGEILLRKAPVIALVSFESIDLSGVATDVDASSYALRDAASKWPRLMASGGTTFAPWLPGYELRVVFRAGFVNLTGSPVDAITVVPARFRQAIKLHVEANYDRDEKMMPQLLAAAENLLMPERSELSLA